MVYYSMVHKTCAVVLIVLLTCCGGGGGGNGGNSSSGFQNYAPCNVLATSETPYNPAFNDGFIYQIIVDSTNVYWYDVDSGGISGSIKSVPKRGGAVNTLATGLGGVQSFVVDDTSVYWAEHDLLSGKGMIKSVPKSGGGIVTLASGFSPGTVWDVFDPQTIAVDSSYVYWSDFGVRRIPKAGGAVTEVIAPNIGAANFALDSTTSLASNIFYWTDSGYKSAPIAGGPTKTILSGASGTIRTFLVDNTNLYDITNNKINPRYLYSIPLVGGPENNIITVRSGSLTTDGTFLYAIADGFSTVSNGVTKISKSAGKVSSAPICVDPNNLATFENVYEITADASNVYAVVSNNGPGKGQVAIVKLAPF
jgi:hypothetical protein